MTTVTFTKQPTILPASKTESIFDDMGYPAAPVARLRGAFAAGYVGDLDITRRVLDMHAALATAGIQGALRIAFAPDFALLGQDASAAPIVTRAFGLGSYGLDWLAGGDPGLKITAVGTTAPRSVLDIKGSIGTNPKITAAAGADLINGLTGVTMMAAINLAAVQAAQTSFFSVRYNGSGFFGIGMISGKLQAIVRRTTAVAAAQILVDPPAINMWVIVTVRFDPATGAVAVLVNDVPATGLSGTFTDTGASVSVATTSTCDVQIGSVVSGQRPGLLSDVWIFDKALTTGEATAAYTAMRAANPQMP